ncbi:putative Ig domain-containing protein, partial [Pelagicoccus enzymogenes]|uniref:putative Ig domain-containing protein n=1 Tax=Pelagicoccus enzymogenes TaxID=2773457 RepID=UPI00280DFA90
FSIDLSESFSDIDAGDTLSYSATLENGDPLPDWLTLDNETGELSGTPENGDVGTISISVTATDSAGASVSDSFTIQVENTNDGPVATTLADQVIDEDSAFSLDASTAFEDVDAGDTLTFSATLENGAPLPSWLSIDSETGELSGTPENGDVGAISVTVTATDEAGETASSNFSIQVENTNDGPTVVSTRGEVLWQEDFSGLSDGSTSDQGETSWTTDASAATATPIHGVSDEAYAFSRSTSTSNDDGALVKLQTETIDISGKKELTLSFDLQSKGDMESSGSWHDYFQVIATVDGVPTELLQQDGNLNGNTGTFTLTNIPEGDSLTISFEAKTTHSSEIFTIDNVTLNGDSYGLANQTATEDAAFSFDASAAFSDEDLGDSLTYAASLENGDPLPDWLSFNAATGEFTGAPTNDNVGTISVSVTASDQSGASVSSTFGIQVVNTNDGPTATAIADQSVDEDALFELDVSSNFADIDIGDTLTYTAELTNESGEIIGDGSLPDWLTFDPATGQFSGTPNNGDVGNFCVKVTASDGEESASDIVAITVENTNDGPVASADTAAVTEGNTIEIDVLANDSDEDIGDTLTITEATVVGGKGTVSIVDNKLVYDPADAFPDLVLDDSEDIEISYTISDGNGGTTTSTATVTVTGDDSLIHLSSGNNSYTATDNDNEIHGFAGHDTIHAEDGDDIIVGGTGNDNLHGGAGDDTFLYSQGDGADDFHGGEG